MRTGRGFRRLGWGVFLLGVALSGGCRRQPASSDDTLTVGGIRWRVTEWREARHYLRSPKNTARLTWELITTTNYHGTGFTHWARVDYRWIEPVAGLSEPARQVLTATLRRAFAGDLVDEEAKRSARAMLRARRDRFFAEYEEFFREFDTSAITYQDEWRLDPLPPVGGVLTVQLDWWSDTGGAHGNGGREYLVFERATGRRLQTADLLQTNATERITALLKTALRRARNLPPEQSLAQAGFWVKQIRPTRAQWAPAPEGLRFHFDAYAIAPYALGPTDGVIPWPEIAPCLTKSFRSLIGARAP